MRTRAKIQIQVYLSKYITSKYLALSELNTSVVWLKKHQYSLACFIFTQVMPLEF